MANDPPSCAGPDYHRRPARSPGNTLDRHSVRHLPTPQGRSVLYRTDEGERGRQSRRSLLRQDRDVDRRRAGRTRRPWDRRSVHHRVVVFYAVSDCAGAGASADQRMFGELVQSVHELPLPRGREKINIVHALTTCHQLKVVDGEVIGDPLDVKMFDFTGWEVEEGRVGGGASKADNGSANKAGGESAERPATLVQTIVRPPGGGKFRLEDAMKTGTRVSHPFCQIYLLLSVFLACAFSRTGCDPYIRVCLCA
jgi:hypothetical protein